MLFYKYIKGISPTMQYIIEEVATRLAYARTAPQTTEDYWMLFTPNINRHHVHDIIATSTAVKTEVNKHSVLSQLAEANKDIIVSYIAFVLLN